MTEKEFVIVDKKQILIVEDDSALAEGGRLNLEIAGFEAKTAYSRRAAEALLEKGAFDLILLDVNLPDGNGVDFAGKIRGKQNIPIVFLTARDLDEDMIAGFQVGADDYITKPFNIQILVQRVKAVLRRYQGEGGEETTLHVGNLLVDFEGHIVTKKGKPLSLTPTEFKLLVKFCRNPGIVLTREVLLGEFWDQDGNFVDEHTLTIFVSRLRTKIADEQFTYIKTVYGTGYRWVGEENG